jgi:hypothetical protein
VALAGSYAAVFAAGNPEVFIELEGELALHPCVTENAEKIRVKILLLDISFSPTPNATH